MRKAATYSFVWAFLVFLTGNSIIAQNRLYMPFQRQSNLPLQHDLDSLGSEFHPDILPYHSDDVEGSKWFQEVYHGDFLSDKIFLDLKLNKKSKKYPIKMSLSPIGEILAGFESGLDAKTFFQTGIGFNFSAMVGHSLDVNINISGSNSSFPSFVENYIFTNQVVPGQGFGYKSDIGYYYNNSNGYVSYQAGKYFNFTAGRGKNKFGEGYRSLLLSDIGNNYNYFRIVTNIWKFKYVNLYTQMDDIYNVPGAPTNKNKKYSTMHYLSINIAKRWSVGLFESIQWLGQDSVYDRGFDPYYLNPIIFLRPVEFSMGSADNVLMGLNMSFKASNKVKLFGQLVLDEFKLSEIKAGNGWWGNKYGTQIGVKYYDAFNVKRLTLQGEWNRVRPYTYSHRSSAQAYGYFNQPIAHPSGANFNEGVFLANYYINKFYIELKTTFMIQGVDSDSVSYGADIFKSYTQRLSDYDNEVGQGTKRTLSTVNLKASYLLSSKANIRVELNISDYSETVGTVTRNIFWVRLGVRTGIFNEDWDF